MRTYQLDHEVSGALTIDAAEGYCECPAAWIITADWEGGEITHASPAF